MPNWLWPQQTNPANTWIVRLARSVHWLATAFVALCALGLLVTVVSGNAGELASIFVPACIVYAIGRSLRYILANE